MSIDVSKLINAKRQPDGGYQCQCPECARNGADRNGKNHLRIYPSGAFNCCVDNSRQHNKAIRAILRGYLFEGEREEVVYIEPKLQVDQIYPEDTLKKLIFDPSYWLGRGMKEDVLRRLENGVAPLEERGKLSGRSVFPCRDKDDRIIGFAGRLLTESSYAPKWKIIGPKSRFLFPWRANGPTIIETKTAILCESIGDVVSLSSFGINNALCLFGLNLSSVIVSTLISVNVNRVIVSLNRDDDPRKGQAAAEKIANKLGSFFSDVRIVLPPNGIKDWGEAAEKHDDAAFNDLRTNL